MNYYNYFTEIEEHFVRRRGKHLLISPMDWGLIATWRDTGIPLQVALRGIDVAMDGFFARPQRGTSKINSLFYCHDSVMAEYANYVEAHVGESSTSPQSTPAGHVAETSGETDAPDKTEVVEFISARISEIKTLAEKQYLSESTLEGIHRVLARLDEIIRDLQASARFDPETLERDLGMADDLLVAELRTAIETERITQWEAEAKMELKVYRKRLSKEIYERIRENFIRRKIRLMFNVEELSLFHL